ncbi:MAG: tetratricopeptide repeat protein [Thermoanaerobaculia bacterium]
MNRFRLSLCLSSLAFAAVLTSCITITPRTQHPSSSATVIPNVPLQHWGIESCGAGSLSSVLQHYGEPTTMAQWDATLTHSRGGVLTIDLLLAARSRGFQAELATGTPELVEREVRRGNPAILMLQVVDSPGRHYDFFHYIVVDGIDPDRKLVRTQFGDGQGRWTTFSRLEKAWAGGGHAAIFIRPEDGTSKSLRAGVALEERGKVPEAIVTYRTILTAHPDSVPAWVNLGNAQSKLGRREEAESAFRKALAIDPASRDALNNLAWLLFEEKRYLEAEPIARRAVAQQGPDSYLVLDTLARVLAARGACDEAQSMFQKAIDGAPESPASARDDLRKAREQSRSDCRTPSS